MNTPHPPMRPVHDKMGGLGSSDSQQNQQKVIARGRPEAQDQARSQSSSCLPSTQEAWVDHGWAKKSEESPLGRPKQLDGGHEVQRDATVMCTSQKLLHQQLKTGLRQPLKSSPISSNPCSNGSTKSLVSVSRLLKPRSLLC